MNKINLQRRGNPSSALRFTVSLLVAAGLAQGQSSVSSASTTIVTTTAATTTTIATTTTVPTTTVASTTTAISTTPSPTTVSISSATVSATTIPISTTTFYISTPPTSFLPPSTSLSTIITTASVTPTPPPVPSSKSSNSNNVPVIVGSVVGAVAVIVIIAVTVICFRRRRNTNKDLTFDALQGLSATGAATAPSRQRFNAKANAPVGRASIGSGAYDDGYEYESQVGASQGYPPQVVGGGYGSDIGYDAYGTPQQGYQNPSIFQEDSLAYSHNANRMRGQGYDQQNLPEIMYRNGEDIHHPSGGATGYYEDNMYNQGAWNQGLWVANPEAEKQYQQQQQQQYQYDYPAGDQYPVADQYPAPDQYPEHPADIELQQPSTSYEKNSINQFDNSSDTAVGSTSSPRSKFRGQVNNPHAIPEDSSPRMPQLRGGDLFGQDSNSATSTSPRIAAATAAGITISIPEGSSPRLASRSEMRSFDLARNSPTRTSGEGVHSYATDFASGSGGRTSATGDRPSMEGGHVKSLRTQRRGDWS
ncbi:hypothetical protein BGZ49_009148 [Haplosporangium sp. Z 27]|nr:hypothetical protein BGZ49_009148 [Haplosporangium sp. Z 27]